MKMQERFVWALKQLDIKPDDVLLEIGCGSGILAGAVGALLKEGRIVALDQSGAMLQRAAAKNDALVHAGKATFINEAIATARLPVHSFNKVFAFNVGLFRKAAASKSLQHITTLLVPGGQLFLFYQPPYEITRTAAAEMEQQLLANHYTLTGTHYEPMLPASVCCIVARPPHL